MTLLAAAGALLVLALFVYLCVALLAPERFQ